MKQEALLVDLADQVREAKLATKTPLESDSGAESAVDSDLKSRADHDMADEPEEPLSPSNWDSETTQGNKRKMVAKAKSGPFIAEQCGPDPRILGQFDVGKPRASDSACKQSKRLALKTRPWGNDPAPGDAEGWILVSRMKKSCLAQPGSSHKSFKDKDTSFGKFCARSLVSGEGQSSPNFLFQVLGLALQQKVLLDLLWRWLVHRCLSWSKRPSLIQIFNGRFVASAYVKAHVGNLPVVLGKMPMVTVMLQLVLKAFAFRLESVVSILEVWRLSRRLQGRVTEILAFLR